MATYCDRCLEKGEKEYGGNSVGSIFGPVFEEDLCDKHYQEWQEEHNKPSQINRSTKQ